MLWGVKIDWIEESYIQVFELPVRDVDAVNEVL